jgi:hypothetical protein
MAPSTSGDLAFWTEYADQTPPPADGAATEDAQDGGADDADENASGDVEVVIPEDLSTLDDDALAHLMASTKDAFTTLYGEDGSGLTDEGLEALSVLTDGIKRLQGETQTRAEAQAKRAKTAAALAEEAGVTFGSEEDPEPVANPSETGEGGVEVGEAPSEDAPGQEHLNEDKEEALASEAPREIRVNLAGLASKGRAPITTQPVETPVAEGQALSQTDLLHAGTDLAGHSAGAGLTIEQLAAGLDRNLAGINVSQWEAAMRDQRPMRYQQSLAVMRKPFDDDLILREETPTASMEMIRHAVDESRLKGGSLTAAGGW